MKRGIVIILMSAACTNIGVVQIGNGNSSSVKQDVSQGVIASPKPDAGKPMPIQYGVFEE